MKRRSKNQREISLPERPTKRALDLLNDHASPTDPQGMYTGIPKDLRDEPQQDADDL